MKLLLPPLEKGWESEALMVEGMNCGTTQNRSCYLQQDVKAQWNGKGGGGEKGNNIVKKVKEEGGTFVFVGGGLVTGIGYESDSSLLRRMKKERVK